MVIIIVGGGKVGFHLAQTLLSHGHEPRVVEINRTRCAELSNLLDLPVTCGDGSLIDVLESAGTLYADALVSVTGKDEDNLIVCQLAKKRFQVGRTLARVNNPKNAGVMKQLGVDIPISVTDNIANLLEREIDASSFRLLVSLNRGEASLSELSIPDDYRLSGITLGELQLPVDSIIVSITREEQLLVPRGNTQVLSGDRLVVLAKNNAMRSILLALHLPVEE
ncbi:MAG: TrkA family potassium uptake protein [Provencibacterium sp.]|jgi:trk system potassium uptake protein TrkA|nr:TrkA family potassium uptake protein [Provencibacterium sp.]